jgi:hypothetical protein
MAGKAFVIMQVGSEDSPDRQRANDIYDYIIRPTVEGFALEPYRADLDATPGAIVPRIISELLAARVVIADLTGRNPNVYYELGIVHSFARPLICLADTARSLPFDTKDERIIRLGELVDGRLAMSDGEKAKRQLQESLTVVLAGDFVVPTPLREAAANRQVDELASDNPLAAEMAQMREVLEEIRVKIAPPPPRQVIPPYLREDISVLREVVERNIGGLDRMDFNMLVTDRTSKTQNDWARELELKWSGGAPDPWLKSMQDNERGPSDEPPF